MRRLSANEDIDTDEDCRYRAVVNMSAVTDSPIRSPPSRAGVINDQFQKKDGGEGSSSLATQFIYSSATTVNSDVQRNNFDQSPTKCPFGLASGGSRDGSTRSTKARHRPMSCCGTREGTAGGHAPSSLVSGGGGRMRALYNSNRHALFERGVRAKWRSIKMLFVVVLEFFVCWTPLFVIQTWKIFDDEGASRSVSAGSMNLIHLLAFVSSCSNPITYCFMSNRFRQCFIGVFGRCSCRTRGGRRAGGGAGGVEGGGRSWRSGGIRDEENRHRGLILPRWDSNRIPQLQGCRFDS